jgi:undecaprenyl-diphosphatase
MLQVDIFVLQFLHHLAGVSKLTDWLIIFFAEYLIYFLVAAFLYFLFKAAKGKKMYFFALAVISTILSRGILTELIRFFFFRLRPFVTLAFNPLVLQTATEASFPSGHMAFLAPLAIVLWYMDHKNGSWFIALTLLVGIARVIAGLHYPSDIVGGLLIGLASFFAVRPFLRKAYPASS